jgi:hypothetical protein
MAQRLGRFDQWVSGEWADRRAINRNADELDAVAIDVSQLQTTIRRQGEELLALRAYVIGLIEVMRVKAPFDDAELDAAVSEAYAEITAPPPPLDPRVNMPKPQVRDDRPTTCAKCGKSVPAYRTNITADGEVCDSCSNR